MSDHSQFVADSLSELLASIADGIREAQTSLSQLPALDANGRPQPSYHLPYLDFTLNVDVETETTDQGLRRVKMLPVKTSNTQQKIHSSIAGRFVAVPPGEGRPITLIALNAVTDISASDALIIEVLLSTSSNELISFAPVEINIDLLKTAQLNPQHADLHLKAHLEQSLLTTNELGRAYTRLQFDGTFPRDAILIIGADANQQYAQISVTRGA